MSWLALAGAIVIEVVATLSLRMASTGEQRRWPWFIPVVVFYPLAFVLLGVTLSLGMTIGVAYGVWTAVGVALTAVLGHFLFHERITGLMALGIALIMGGVILVEFGGR